MASNYASVKLSAPFVEEARREAETVHRSLGAQVEYWARLGRSVENTPGFGIERVRQLLSDPAADAEVVTDAMTAIFDDPDTETRAYYAGLGKREGAVGDDAKGRLVRREASGRRRPIA